MNNVGLFGFREKDFRKVPEENCGIVDGIVQLLSKGIVKCILQDHHLLVQHIEENPNQITTPIATYSGPFENKKTSRFFSVEKTMERVDRVHPKGLTILDPKDHYRAYNSAFFVKKILEFSWEQKEAMLENNSLSDVAAIILCEAIHQKAGFKPFVFPSSKESVDSFTDNNDLLKNIDVKKIEWRKCTMLYSLVHDQLDGLYQSKLYTITALNTILKYPPRTLNEPKKTPPINIKENNPPNTQIKKDDKKCVLF